MTRASIFMGLQRGQGYQLTSNETTWLLVFQTNQGSVGTINTTLQETRRSASNRCGQLMLGYSTNSICLQLYTNELSFCYCTSFACNYRQVYKRALLHLDLQLNSFSSVFRRSSRRTAYKAIFCDHSVMLRCNRCQVPCSSSFSPSQGKWEFLPHAVVLSTRLLPANQLCPLPWPTSGSRLSVTQAVLSGESFLTYSLVAYISATSSWGMLSLWGGDCCWWWKAINFKAQGRS